MHNNNIDFLFVFDGKDAKTLARHLGFPKELSASRILAMPMAVVQDGLRSAHVWRTHHWGFGRGPQSIQWEFCRGTYTVFACNSDGNGETLAKQISIDYDVCVAHYWTSPYHPYMGAIWRHGKKQILPHQVCERAFNKVKECAL